MATFDVDVGGATYEVDAPDERTAWKWANWTHAKEKPTPLPERPANLRKPEELSTLDKILVNWPSAPKPMLDFATGATGILRGGGNLVSEGLGDWLAPKAPGSEGSFGKTVGAFADPLALAIGGGVGKVLPYAPVLGKGITEGVKALAKNVAGGAVAGGAIGGLSEEGSVEGGAALGAGLNVVLPPVLIAGARAVGWLADALSGKLTTAMASSILKSAAGSELPAIQAAMKNAPPGTTAAQAAAGIKQDTWNALDDLAKRVDKENYFSRLADTQKAEVIAALRTISGAANQTGARQVSSELKKELNAITTPMRETELGAADIAGRLGPRLQGEAEALGEAASGKVADVRRLESAKQAAERVAQSGRGRLGADSAQPDFMPRLSGRYSYGDELANLAERLSQKSADDSLILGEGSRFKQMQLASLEQHGLRPLKPGGIISDLNRKLADPSIGTSDLNTKVLERVRDKIIQWTNSDGVIEPHALYGIRKSAVNESVEQLMGTVDPKSKSKMAAGLLNHIKPLIDDAIEKAGGTGWRNYLKTFEAGSRLIDQQKMGAKALDLFNKQPNTLESLAAGNEPKMVEKIFKSDYDLRKVMGKKVEPIDRAAAYLSREREILEGAARGKGGLERIIEENLTKFKLPNWINAKIAVTNRALSEIENRVNKFTMAKVEKAMRTGQSANMLLSFVPKSERPAVIAEILRGHGPVMGGVVSGSMPESQ